VAGIATPTNDSKIMFEVWLPVNGWNGKFEQVGNGGLAGAIPFSSMAGPLLRGYATAATDDGHEAAGTDGTWALGHPEKVTDFAQRSVHETSVQAKALVHALYGKDPGESYFVGCSEGGREALMEAQRYPNDFIGIIAGAPANSWTHLLDTAAWIEQTVRSDAASAIPPEKLSVIQKAVVAKCDTLDGVKDGVIADPMVCKFDPATVQCAGADGPDCLTVAQVAAVKRLYDGPKNPRTGEQIYPGFAPGTEAVPGNWQAWVTGGAAGSNQAALAWLFGNSYFGDILFGNPNWDFRTFNFDTDVKLNDDKLGALLNATDPDLGKFKARGGKLIQFHGWGDAAISPFNSVNYFESVQARMASGSRAATAELGATAGFYRLFMVPGMSHCGGGLGANSFGNGNSPAGDAEHDIVTALAAWVEKGVAPDKVVATGFVDGERTKGTMTRPLCPYPQQARYSGTGDTNDAASFVCAVPTR
jgi:feruloyl esterase